MESVDQRLQAVFRSVFDLPENSDVTVCDRYNTAGWDSMGHVNLMVAIEEEFGIPIDAGDSMNIDSYRSALQYLLQAA